MKKFSIEEIQEIGYQNGFVFGKYTKQITLDDDFERCLTWAYIDKIKNTN